MNLKSDTEVEFEMIAQLSSELGSLLSVANSVHSDLIPGIYEGGMKIWECAHDLIEYLATESAISLCGRSVLELGCGVGLPGIFALLCGAECAHFQDFNHGVLSCMTIPSALASLKSGQPKFNSGQATISGQTSMKTGKEQSKWRESCIHMHAHTRMHVYTHGMGLSMCDPGPTYNLQFNPKLMMAASACNGVVSRICSGCELLSNPQTQEGGTILRLGWKKSMQ